jgi:hypothetical protein
MEDAKFDTCNTKQDGSSSNASQVSGSNFKLGTNHPEVFTAFLSPYKEMPGQHF